MSLVIPFLHCIARPDQGRGPQLLTEHLETVAKRCGRPDGDGNQRLGFLAGLLHDAAKCHSKWQAYINGKTPKGPPHAPMGAALFAFTAYHLITLWAPHHGEKRNKMLNSLLDWTLAVHSHHGPLADIDHVLPPWEASAAPAGIRELVSGCDLNGLFLFIRSYFPEFNAKPDQFMPWLDSFYVQWERCASIIRPRILKRAEHPFHQLALQFPATAARLIFADRSHAAHFDSAHLSVAEAEKAIRCHETYCRRRADKALRDGASPELVNARKQVLSFALRKYMTNCQANFFTLELPTGYGKTLSSLRVALQACVSARCDRIVYVAPYISILSQAASEIANATALEVFEHHHLAIAERLETSNQHPNDLLEKADDHDFDALDTWQAPILATTFNQFFRALFPRRAQETLRIHALRRAFIIIDEPQTIHTSVWNRFLRALHAASSQWQCQTLFASATLRPLYTGLPEKPIPLAPPSVPHQSRYVIHARDEILDTSQLAELAAETLHASPNLAIVLNTIRDCFEIYKALENIVPEPQYLHCLTAMMLPSHKMDTIQKIRRQLAKGNKVVAVCTQLLEAGVDLSFRNILRARPIFPSVAQVAGRANRHAEGDPAAVIVFPFARDAENESRQYVYRDETACRHTDRILQESPHLEEKDIPQALKTWFTRCWEENQQTASLDDFQKAAHGQWSLLAGIQPFGGGPPKDEIFVPLPELPLNPSAQKLVRTFAPGGPQQLLQRYLDKDFRKKLSFLERKRLSLALRQYIVPANHQISSTIAHAVNDWLWEINDLDDYSFNTGLAHHLHEEHLAESTLIL